MGDQARFILGGRLSRLPGKSDELKEGLVKERRGRVLAMLTHSIGMYHQLSNFSAIPWVLKTPNER